MTVKTRDALVGSPFLAACAGKKPVHTPVWFMRQAGRSLPEYRALRAGKRFDDLILDPALAAEVTLQPVRRHGVDAAIFFSDIITSPQAIVPGISIEPGRGPVIEQPFRTLADVDRLRPFTPELHVPYVIEAVQQACVELDSLGVPLIGFAGAPFTVATYLIEGGKSKEFAHVKTMMRADPETWFALLDALADMAIATLRAQVGAGASAIQLFDSWAGNSPKPITEPTCCPQAPKYSAHLVIWEFPVFTLALALASCWQQWLKRAPISLGSIGAPR